ncbi:hypothetical protein D3C75_1193020 [compost metagenome]
MHGGIGFAGEAPVEEGDLRRLGSFLQLLGSAKSHLGFGAEQLMAGQGVIDEPAQAIVQAQLAGVGGAEAALLQGGQQVETSRVRLRCPVLKQAGLLVGLGGDEVVGVAGLGSQGQQ